MLTHLDTQVVGSIQKEWFETISFCSGNPHMGGKIDADKQILGEILETNLNSEMQLRKLCNFHAGPRRSGDEP